MPCTSNTAHACAICAHPAPLVCTTCRSIWYCSAGCQKADWPLHEHVCKLFSRHTERPSPDHKRAIVFEERCSPPRLVWIEDRPGTFGHVYDQIETLIQPNGSERRSGLRPQELDDNLRLKLPLDRELQLWHHDNFLADGFLPNGTLLRLTGGAAVTEWRGTLVATRPSGKVDPPDFSNDFTAADFRHLMDHIVMFGGMMRWHPMTNSLSGAGQVFEKAQTVKGVRVACAGEAGKAGKYTSIEIPLSHEIYSKGEVPRISRFVGLPVRVWQCPLSLGRADSPALLGELTNEGIESLFMAADPASPDTFDLAPYRWEGLLGSVLVMHERGKNLAPCEVEALCDFSKNHLQPAFENAASENTQMREQAVKLATKERFEGYCMKCQETKEVST